MRLLRMFVALVAVLMVSAVIQFSSAAPAGGRGLVLVDGVPMDRLPQGEMIHQSGLRVTFVNYDAGLPDARVMLEIPAEGEVLASDTVAIGGDPAGGKRDVDGMVAYIFRELMAHHHQGGVFTLRLTVDAMGSYGPDHRVLTFSVDCPPEEEGTGEEGEGDQGSDESVGVAPAAGAVEDQPGFAG